MKKLKIDFYFVEIKVNLHILGVLRTEWWIIDENKDEERSTKAILIKLFTRFNYSKPDNDVIFFEKPNAYSVRKTLRTLSSYFV